MRVLVSLCSLTRWMLYAEKQREWNKRKQKVSQHHVFVRSRSWMMQMICDVSFVCACNPLLAAAAAAASTATVTSTPQEWVCPSCNHTHPDMFLSSSVTCVQCHVEHAIPTHTVCVAQLTADERKELVPPSDTHAWRHEVVATEFIVPDLVSGVRVQPANLLHCRIVLCHVIS